MSIENNKIKYKNWIIFILTIFIITFFLYIFNEKSDSDNIKITVITKSKQGNIWKMVNEGLYSAANEYGVDIQILAPDYEKDADVQVDLLISAIEDETDAIIISPIDIYKIKKAISNISNINIPIIEMISKTENDMFLSYIGSDHYKIGEQIAKELIKSIGNEGNIFLISTRENSMDLILREKGIRDYIEKNSFIKIIDTKFCMPNEISISKITEYIINNYDDVDAIVGLNQELSSGIGKTISSLHIDKDIVVIGVDFSDDIMGYIENNHIDKVIVQNYFSIGYLALRNAVYEIKNKRDIDDVIVESNVISLDNMFDNNTQKILFPLE